MKKIKGVIWILLLVSVVFAKEDADALLRDVKKTYDEHKNLAIDFSQKFLWNMTGEQVGMSGKIFIQDGEKFKIETPDNLVVNDGKTLSTLNYTNQQVIVNTADKDGGDHPFLKDFIEKYIQEYNAEWIDEQDNVAHLKLKAKSQDEFIHTIELYIDTKTDFIKEVVQYDANDNVTTYSVDAIDTQVQLTASDFKIPDIEKYEVIDMR